MSHLCGQILIPSVARRIPRQKIWPYLSRCLSSRTSQLVDVSSSRLGSQSFIQSELSSMTKETKKLADQILKHHTTTTTSSNAESNVQAEIFAERLAVSRAITLLESKAPPKQEQANSLLLYLQQQHHDKKSKPIDSLRIGIAGSPGAGKSTLVEAFGTYILSLSSSSGEVNEPKSSNSSGHSTKNDEKNGNSNSDVFIPDRLAVVCVDPSSVVSGGSILGDKTRMTNLSAQPWRAFVRPAPSKSTLGGLAGERTHDVIELLTEYAGYNTALIETVGLGQSEVDIAQCVDITVLLIPPGGGDALQGAKKGILEVADIVCVTKADGDLMGVAQNTAADYQGALQLIRSTAPSRSSSNDHGHGHGHGKRQSPRVLLLSSQTGLGLPELWQAILQLRNERLSSGEWQQQRQKQGNFWMWESFRNMVQVQVQKRLKGVLAMNAAAATGDDRTGSSSKKTEDDTLSKLPPRVAAARLLQLVFPPENGDTEEASKQ